MKKFVLALVLAITVCVCIDLAISSNNQKFFPANVSASTQKAPEATKISTPDDRKAFAETAEKSYLMDGKDVHMSAIGKNADTLRMRYVLLGRPDAYQLSQNTEFIASMKKIGFHKIVLTDGYNATYIINVGK